MLVSAHSAVDHPGIRWTHKNIVDQVIARTKQTNPFLTILDECQKSPKDTWNFDNCFSWFTRAEGPRHVVIDHLVQLVDFRTTKSCYMHDGVVEPYDSMICRVSQEYAREVARSLADLFKRAKDPVDLALLCLAEPQKIEKMNQRCKEFDALAVEARKRAAEIAPAIR